MGIKVIITGATGMVGEGVLLTCLQQPEVDKVLMVNRRHSKLEHSKLKELIIPDFLQLDNYTEQLSSYDACFFCAGISSLGMKEEKYTHITYDTTLNFANKLVGINSDMVFNFVSGAHTDGSEKGKVMWARVKGRAENALMKLPFRGQYNFRPGGMKTVEGQQNSNLTFKIIVGILSVFIPKQILSIRDIGLAMINTTTKGYPKQVLEIKDIKACAKA